MKPFHFSASQIATFRDCPSKWYFDKTTEQPRLDTASTLLGKQVHSELEAWLKRATPPSHAKAKALLPLLPVPRKDLKVEHEIALVTPSGKAKGFIDLVVPKGFPKDLCPPSIDGRRLAVFDHKTTANIDAYAKSTQDLQTDPQALLYGLAARVMLKEAGEDPSEDIDICWNYVQTKGASATKAVSFRQSLAILEDGMAPLLDEAAIMRKAMEERPGVKDLGHSLDACDKFGGCPHRKVCPHYTGSLRVNLADAWGVDGEIASAPAEPTQGEKGMSETLARLAAARNAAQVAKTAPKPAAPVTMNITIKGEGTVTPPPAAIPAVTPEPTLPAIDASAVAPSAEVVSIVPPDAPAPTKGKRKPPAVIFTPASEAPGELAAEVAKIQKLLKQLALSAVSADKMALASSAIHAFQYLAEEDDL
jgi:hypothetical protein